MDNQEQHFWGGNNVLQNYGTIDSMDALEEEIALLASEWSTASGETVDALRREIARLREKMGR